MSDFKQIQLNDTQFGFKVHFVFRNGAAAIQVEYGGRVYETAMVDQGPVGFPKEAA
jgi:hypothetical protein